MQENAGLKNFDHAKSEALKFLSIKPLSSKQLEEKLLKKGFSEEDVKKTLQYFISKGFLDDQKLADALAASFVSQNTKGAAGILSDLKKRGLSKEVSEKALEGISDDNESARALKLAEGHFGRISNLRYDQLQRRVYGYLKRRGFSNEAIFFTLKKLVKNFNENDLS